MKKILLLNPPGKKFYIRDNFCSKVSKGYYLTQPLDLVIQSGYLQQAGFDLFLIDAVVEKKNRQKTIDEIKNIKPDAIFSLVGSVNWDNDKLFLKEIKNIMPETKIICCGDLLLFDPEKRIKDNSFIDAIILNFFTNNLVKYLKNDFENIKDIVYKKADTIISSEKSKRNEEIDLPVPDHKLFLNRYYRFSYVTKYPMATTLTTYACPFPCSFCIMSTLEFKYRTLESIKKELISLKELGYKYIYFQDQTLGSRKTLLKQMCEFMIEKNFKFQWCCFSRVDVLDEEIILLMKKAGCNVIMFGVEFADNELLAKYKKHYTLEQIKATFALTKKAGIKRMGTFLLGVPGQTRESIIKTINFAKEIDCDYASFNFAVPRVNTVFREEALEMGLVSEDNEVMDQSGDFITMGTGYLSTDEIADLRKYALKSFYLRPGYILKKLLSIRSLDEFKTHILEALSLLKKV